MINRKERKDRKAGKLRERGYHPAGDRVYFPKCLFFFVFSAFSAVELLLLGSMAAKVAKISKRRSTEERSVHPTGGHMKTFKFFFLSSAFFRGRMALVRFTALFVSSHVLAAR